MEKRIFSGIQPTGKLHIGNYLGAIKQWVEMQSPRWDHPSSTSEVNWLKHLRGDPAVEEPSTECIFCIVDLHAITLPQNPAKLRENIYKTAAVYLAAGIDPEKSTIFVQSSRPEHTQLAWLLNCLTKMGELSRMTQFKDKSQKGSSDDSSVGLFDYPVLMAADILLYKTTHVPVGEDQKQHVELARDLAIRFNKNYGETFVVPEPVMKKTGARIMGLDDPTKKMSKSAPSALNYIALDDDADTIRNKMRKAVTDSGQEIKSGPDKLALTNLLNIYSEFSGKSVSEIESEFSGRSYSEFKESLAEVIINYLTPFQEKYHKYLDDREYLKKVLNGGSEKLASRANEILSDVSSKMGIGL